MFLVELITPIQEELGFGFGLLLFMRCREDRKPMGQDSKEDCLCMLSNR